MRLIITHFEQLYQIDINVFRCFIVLYCVLKLLFHYTIWIPTL